MWDAVVIGGGVIGCAALSLAAYFVLKLIFPDRMEEAEKTSAPGRARPTLPSSTQASTRCRGRRSRASTWRAAG